MGAHSQRDTSRHSHQSDKVEEGKAQREVAEKLKAITQVRISKPGAGQGVQSMCGA